MAQTFVFRSQAAADAQRQNHSSFRTTSQDEMWKSYYEPGTSPAHDWAKYKDYVAWVETDWDRSAEHPTKLGVLIVSCRREEIPADDLAQIVEHGFLIEPQTPSLWDGDSVAKGGGTRGKTSTGGPRAPRAKSDALSPVKTVWATADEMVGASRIEVIAACVAKGVNKSTASTQFYRWQQAKKL